MSPYPASFMEGLLSPLPCLLHEESPDPQCFHLLFGYPVLPALGRGTGFPLRKGKDKKDRGTLHGGNRVRKHMTLHGGGRARRTGDPPWKGKGRGTGDLPWVPFPLPSFLMKGPLSSLPFPLHEWCHPHLPLPLSWGSSVSTTLPLPGSMSPWPSPSIEGPLSYITCSIHGGSPVPPSMPPSWRKQMCKTGDTPYMEQGRGGQGTLHGGSRVG